MLLVIIGERKIHQIYQYNKNIGYMNIENHSYHKKTLGLILKWSFRTLTKMQNKIHCINFITFEKDVVLITEIDTITRDSAYKHYCYFGLSSGSSSGSPLEYYSWDCNWMSLFKINRL